MMNELAEPVYSKHANMRGQQRGLKRDTTDLVWRYGDIEVSIGKGCQAIRLSRAGLNYLKSIGYNQSQIDRCQGVVIVCAEDGKTIVTTMHNHGPTAKRYRRVINHQVPRIISNPRLH